MATKEAVFSLRVDTGDSVNDVNSFDKAVKSLDKSLQDTSKTASASTGLDSFDAKLKEINDRVNGGGLTMRELTRAMKDYQTVAIQSGVQSPVGMDALKNASKLKDEIGDLKAQTTALSSDFVGLDTALAGVETGTAVFQGIQSAMALAGVENEALVQTMVKLQATQGLVNTVNTIAKNLNSDAILGIQLRNAVTKIGNFINTGSATTTSAQALASAGLATAQSGVAVATGLASGAMKIFRLALISTGIGALVVLVGALVGAYLEFQGANDEAVASIDRQADAVERLTEMQEYEMGILDQLGSQSILQAKLRGASDSELLKLERKNYNERVKFEWSQLNEKIKKNAKIINNEMSTLEQLKKANENHTKAIQRQNTLRHEVDIKGLEFKLKDQENNDKEEEKRRQQAEKYQQQQEKRKQDEIKRREDLLKNLQDSVSKEIQIREQLEDLKIKNIKDDTERNVANLNEQFGDFKDELLKNSIKKEVDALDEKFKKGKMTEQQYRDDLAIINANAINKLSADEKALLTLKEIELNDAILVVQKAGQDTKDQKQAEADAKRMVLLEMFNSIVNSKYQEDLNAYEKIQKEKSIALSEALGEGVITEEEFMAGQLILEDEYNKKIIELNKEKNAIIKEQERKTREEQLKSFTDSLATAQKVLDQVKVANDLMNEIGNARIIATNEQRDEDLAKLEENKRAELSIEGMSSEQRKAIEEDYNNQKYKIQIKAYEEEDKIKRAQFNRSKAIKLAQIGIDTASAIAKGIAEFGPPPSPMGILAIASASAIGLTQALAVKNSKYQSGSMPQAPSTSTGGVSSGASGSSFMVGSSGTSTTGLPGTNQTNNATTPVQVYVLENDISSTQNKVALQEKKSSF